jgi:hypothetical protein
MPTFKLEASDFQSSTSPRGQFCKGSLKSEEAAESTPLLARFAGPSSAFGRIRRKSSSTLDPAFVDRFALNFRTGREEAPILYHSSDEPHFLNFIMEKVKSSKIAHWAGKLAVESEPGLTNAQLMLHNHDLKPGKYLAGEYRKVDTNQTLQLSQNAVSGVLGISWVSGLLILSTLYVHSQLAKNLQN